MSLEILNTPYIQNKIKHTGEKVLFVVTLLLFLDHIRIINFENVGFGWINIVFCNTAEEKLPIENFENPINE